MTDIALPGLPVTDAPPREAEAPSPPAEEQQAPPDRNRRRKIALLLFLLVTAVALVLFAIWYLLNRQPVETLIPVIGLTNPPGYQASAYGMSKPLGIAVTADGSRIYVTQSGAERATLMLDAAGNQLGTLAPPPTVSAEANQLYVAINPRTGDVFATDRAAGAVYQYGADGVYKAEFKPSPSLPGWQPLAIAFDGAGNLYVADVGGASQRVHVFAPDGSLVRDLGVAEGLTFPNGIAIDSAGKVYVADSNNGRLLVFGADGARVALVQRGSGQGDLGMPRGVAIDGRSRVYVVDTVGQGVQMYRVMQQTDPAPVFLTSFGREGTVDGAFEFPNGVAVDGRGHVYVADWNNDRVQIWSY